MIKPFWEYKQNKKGALDIPVGETFEYREKNLKVVSANDSCERCKQCVFDPGSKHNRCIIFACFSGERMDGQGVIFKEVKNEYEKRQ